MSISAERIQDGYAAIAFADDVSQLYGQLATMRAKIERYIASAAAVAAETATDREQHFVNVVRAAVDQPDLDRIGLLLPMIVTTIATLETDYGDFIHPG